MIKNIFILIIAFIVIGCGGGSNVENSSTNNSTTTKNSGENDKNKKIGHINDIKIDNLQYTTETITDSVHNSIFSYTEGETIKFYINGIKIGETTAKEDLSLFDVVADSEDIFSDRLLNTLVLMKTFDKDHNLDNGIELTNKILQSNKNMKYYRYNSTAKTCSIDNNKVFIDLPNSIFNKNLNEELKTCSMEVYKPNKYDNKNCQYHYTFDPRVKVKTCNDHINAFWIDRYVKSLLSRARSLRNSEKESFDSLQKNVNNLLYRLDGAIDVFSYIEGKKNIKTDTETIVKVTSALMKNSLSINADETDKNKLNTIIAAMESFAELKNKKPETFLKLFESYGIVVNNKFMEEFFSTFSNMDGLKKGKRIKSALFAMSKAIIMSAIEDSKTFNNFDKRVGGGLKNLINAYWSFGEAMINCRGKTNIEGCTKSILNTAKYGLVAPVWTSSAAVFNYYIWSDNREFAKKLEKEAYYIDYLTKINLKEELIEEDSKKYYSYFSIENFLDDMIIGYTSSNIDKNINFLNNLVANNYSSSYSYKPEDIYKVLNEYKNIARASKGHLFLRYNKNNNKISITYNNPINEGLTFNNNYKVTCWLNNSKILEQEDTSTYFNKIIPLKEISSTENELTCKVKFGNLEANKKTLNITKTSIQEKISLDRIEPQNIKANRSKHGKRIIIRGNNFNKNCKVHYQNNSSKGVFSSSHYINKSTMSFNIITMNSTQKWSIWVEDENMKSNKLYLNVDTSVNRVCMPYTKSYKSCNIINGIGIKLQKCSIDGNSWKEYSQCVVQKCNSGYHVKNNQCIQDNIHTQKITLNSSNSCINNQPIINLSWNEINNVNNYKIHSNRVFPSGEYLIDVPNNNTSITLDNGLKSNYNYQLYVRAELSDGSIIKSNEIIVNTQDCDHSSNNDNAPDRPNGLTPGTRNKPYPELDTTNITFRWGSAASATYYKLSVFDYNTKEYLLREQNVNSNYYNAKNILRDGHTYFWEVKACNDNGCSYERRVYFKTKGSTEEISKPTGLTPGSKSRNNPEIINNTSVQLRWNSVNNAKYYKVWVIRAKLGHSGVIVIRGAKTANTSYNLSGLNRGEDYTWFIDACNDDKCSESDYYGFQIKGIEVGTPRKINVSINGTSANISWDSVNQATKYKVNIYDQDGNDDRYEYTSDNSIRFDNLLNNHTYKVKVRAYIGNNHGDYSDYYTFTIEKANVTPKITSISPNPIYKSKNYQYVKIYGNNFTNKSKVAWKTSNGSSGIVSEGHTYFINKNLIKLYIRVVGSSSSWEFSVINTDGKISQWSRVSTRY